MTRFWRILLAAVLAQGCYAARAQAGGDVTVRLFSTRIVTALTVTPHGIGATLRRCATCRPQPIDSALLLSEGADGMRLNGQALSHVLIDGEILLQVKDAPAHSSPVKTSSAAGKWQIDSVHGELRVVLTVPRERYVMAVLAGEAAPDDPPAALEALAIVARSYALAGAGKHRVEGFDFSDSTESQAAVFAAVADRVRDAVQATAGETLWVGHTRVAAYFSENCGGMTEDAASLWGGAQKPWLIAHADPYCERTAARWHAEISSDDLRAALAAEGWKLAGPVTALRVLTRTPSGRAARVEVVGGTQHIMIPAEQFRLAIGRALGWNKLRSDWYTVGFGGGRAVFEGRGYGHGVGLCQAGARAFATQHDGDAREVSRAILRFYFPSADMRVEAADHGWQQRDGDGWTLASVAPDDVVMHAGNAAWAQAQKLFVVANVPHPMVRIYPGTDLFRQATARSGWTLGATRGKNISLQPTNVIVRHETLERLMLHEFLHVLVESEATDAAPLWLREGLVEWLANLPGAKTDETARTVGQRSSRDKTLHATVAALAAIEDGLVHPASWQQADAAHHAASLIVSQMIARYGTGVVRSWLRSGVPNGVLAR